MNWLNLIGRPIFKTVSAPFDTSTYGFEHYFNLAEAGASSKLHPNTDGSGTIADTNAVNYIDGWYPGVVPMAGYSTENGGGPIWDATNKLVSFTGNQFKLRTITANANDPTNKDRTLCIYIKSITATAATATICGGENNRGQFFKWQTFGDYVYNSNGAFVGVSTNFSFPMFIQQQWDGTVRLYGGSTVAQLGSTVTTAGTSIGGTYILIGNHEAGFSTAVMTVQAFACKFSLMSLADMQSLSTYWRSF